MYLVFDIGATNMRLAVSDDGKNLISTKVIPTPKNFDEGIKIFCNTALELSGPGKINKIAGGLKGPLDKNKSLSTNPPDLPDWKNKPFKKRLQEALNAPVFLENDTALDGLGESTFGAGVGKNIVVYITVSTGVGGVRIVGGNIDKNAYGFEIGHQIIDYKSTLVCGCGGLGHLEAHISGSAIEKIYAQKGENIKDPEIWDNITKLLAVGLNNITVHWSPEIIILGGAVMKSISLEKVKFYFEKTLTIFPTTPELVLAKLDDLRGLYGALKLLSYST